jgi:hypothetical protein
MSCGFRKRSAPRCWNASIGPASIMLPTSSIFWGQHEKLRVAIAPPEIAQHSGVKTALGSPG